MCVCACVRLCVRAFVRACVRACVCPSTNVLINLVTRSIFNRFWRFTRLFHVVFDFQFIYEKKIGRPCVRSSVGAKRAPPCHSYKSCNSVNFQPILTIQTSIPSNFWFPVQLWKKNRPSVRPSVRARRAECKQGRLRPCFSIFADLRLRNHTCLFAEFAIADSKFCSRCQALSFGAKNFLQSLKNLFFR